ncbi:glutamate-rich protein 2 isoform X1 [Trichomycterus rosablanca]|uniref:glutamate-rich protein 2 isoform X1 n=1 Tax=Trichomycterus rosablanca TaxID=2290929 RepID=UPI002F35E615
MSRLACVGKSSKDAAAVKAVAPKPEDTPASKSLQLKTQISKTPHTSRSEERQHPLISDERGNVRGNTRVAVDPGPRKDTLGIRRNSHPDETAVNHRASRTPNTPQSSRSEEKQHPLISDERGNTRVAVDPCPMKDTLGTRRNSRPDETAVNHRASRSEAGPLLNPPSPADKTPHGQDKPPKHFPPVHAEDNCVSEYMEQRNEPALQKTQYQELPKCPNDQSTGEEENEDEEKCGEDEDTAEFPAPLELLAEFLKAVMEKNYILAKKLCQMILIYEPENAEAKHFLPLIEERLLIEEAQEDTCSDDNTSDDNGNEGSTDDDDDGDDESSDSDTDSSDCSTSSSDVEEKNISQHQTASLSP